MRAKSISLTSAEPTDDKAAARYRSDFLGTVEKPWRPSPLPLSELSAAQQALAAFDEYLRPQDWEDNGRAMRAIAALLSYYRQPDRAPDLEASVAEQWGEDVEDYPLWTVQEACRIWRREPANRRGPHPGEFRAICEGLVGKARQQRDRLRRCLEMPPLLSAPIPLTAEERTALEERRKSERMAELARFEEIKASLLAEGKWPGRIAGPAPACDTAPASDAESIHCPSVLAPTAHGTSESSGEPFPPGTSNSARPESASAPASPEQPAAIGSSGAAGEFRTSDRTPEIIICRDAGNAGPPDQACLIRSFEMAVPQTRPFTVGTGTAILCSPVAITKPPAQGEVPEDFRVGPADRTSLEVGNRNVTPRGVEAQPFRAERIVTYRDRLRKPPLSRRQSLHFTESHGKKPLMRRHPESVDARRMRGDLHSLLSVHLVGDDEIDISLVQKAWPTGDFRPRQATSGTPFPDPWIKKRPVKGPDSAPPVKRPELRWSSRALTPSHPAAGWSRPELPIRVQGCSPSSNLSRRWSLSRHHRNAKVPPSMPLAGACFLQVTAERQPLAGCLPIVRTSVGCLGKGRTGVARFRPRSMFSSAGLRTGGGLTIRRSRCPGIGDYSPA